jgi:hypothetical protein
MHFVILFLINKHYDGAVIATGSHFGSMLLNFRIRLKFRLWYSGLWQPVV